MFHKGPVAFVMILLLASYVWAQGWWEQKPYSSWSKDEVTNLLDKSPWGNVVNQSIERIGHIRASADSVQGTESAYDKLMFHISLVTAKPVRMALARRLILSDPGKEHQTDWAKYIDQGDDQNIVVVVSLNATPSDSNIYLITSAAMDGYKTEDLADQTYLANDAGKKVALTKYDPLGESGYGVKFYFPRNTADGSPLISAGSKEIRFQTVLPLPKDKSPERKNIMVTTKWDPRKMTFQGKVEY